MAVAVATREAKALEPQWNSSPLQPICHANAPASRCALVPCIPCVRHLDRTPPPSNRPSGANDALIAVCAGLLEMQESGRTGNVLEAHHWQGE